MTPAHIPLARRKTLSAKLLFIESKLAIEKRLKKKERFQLEKLAESIFSLLNSDNSENNNRIHLDVYLKEIIEEIQRQSDHFFKEFPKTQVLFAKILNRNLKHVSCRSCIRGAFPEPCNGSDEDDTIVSEKGYCIRPLQRMFDIASQALTAYYARFSTPRGQIWPDIYFSTYIDESPHDLDIESYAGGTTEFHDLGSYSSEIQLNVSSRKFNSLSLKTVPYILFHECIVHAYHGIYPPPVHGRVRTSVKDSFCEGWMDWTALRIMKDIFSGQCPVSCSPNGIMDLRGAIDGGDRFHLAKHDSPSEERLIIASEVAAGRTTAWRVHNFMTAVPQLCDKGDPWNSFLRLSFDLNIMSDFPEKKRTDFIDRLYLFPDDLKRVSKKQSAFVGHFSDYLIDLDLKRLIDSVCNF